MIPFFSLLLWILLTYWKERWLTIGLSLQILAPYVHLSSISMMVLLSWPVAIYLIHLEGEARMRRYQITSNGRRRNTCCSMLMKLRALQVAVGLPFFLILLCLYVVPFGTHSPCLQEREKLAPKPTFFGHRGAPRLGPENTIMSFEKAVEYGAHGLESDIQISIDGVPFLMHDYDLTRTTNIKEVMPNASSRNPSFFEWSFLSTLNAGKWFSDAWIKPFFHMKPLSEADKKRARNQRIAKLTDLLKIAQKEKKLVIFDLNSPPPRHPSRKSYIHLVVRVILDSKIEQHLIAWLPGSERKYIKSKAPGFQHVGTYYTLKELADENITRINVDYKRLYYNGLRSNSHTAENLPAMKLYC
nr:glycerophosphodiester phosphodiesterase domain-containing protein 4-like [Odocoileus virginianus texanus]